MKFIREYIIRIEGEPTTTPVQFRPDESIARELEQLHATQFFANQVERAHDTDLVARKVTVIPIPVDTETPAVH